MTKKPTDVSLVAAAPRFIVKLPNPGTQFFTYAVVSFVLTTHKIMLDVVTKLFVTVNDVAEAAKFTVPDGLLMVWFPVVPPAVLVASKDGLPAFEIENFSVNDPPPVPALIRYLAPVGTDVSVTLILRASYDPAPGIPPQLIVGFRATNVPVVVPEAGENPPLNV